MPFRQATSEIRNPDGSTVFRLDGFDVPKAWSQVAADVLAQKYFRKAGVPSLTKPVREKGVPSFLWRSVPDEEALAACPRRSASAARPARGRSSTGWPAPGPTGAGRAAISRPRTTPPPIIDEMRYMLAARWRRRTRRSGSTPGCTGPMASTGRARGITTSTSRRASWCARPAPTSTRSRMPASSSRSATTSSTRAASWICGTARRGSSNTARGRARIFLRCAPRTRRWAAAASPPA